LIQIKKRENKFGICEGVKKTSQISAFKSLAEGASAHNLIRIAACFSDYF